MTEPPNHTSCHVRRELADHFATTARLYSEAVVTLTGSYGPMPSDEYDRLRKTTAEAHRRLETMRTAFEQHIDSHRCITGAHVQFHPARPRPAIKHGSVI